MEIISVVPRFNLTPTSTAGLVQQQQHLQSSGGGGVISTTSATTPNGAITSKHTIPSDILDDLASRFIINVPVHERKNLIRICFQIELAHWFYLDFFCAIEEKKLVPCGIKQFALHLFQHIPFLRTHLPGVDKILEDWKNYKLSVPTYGAILISEDLNYVLLVQSYWAKSSWGFPKGKVNEHEDPVHCATREVYEETGYDITGLIVPNDYIEAVINYQYTRLYIVRNVSMKTLFSPRTRKEIKCCEWFPVDSLPMNKSDAISKTNLGINANSFFMTMPFIKRLKKWINDNRSGIETRKFSTSSSSPITTFNNCNGNGNKSLNVCINSSNNISSTNKKDNNNSVQSSNENFALNLNNNNNNNCSGGSNKQKRQRHKSMGDIDGIKLKLSYNNSCNGKILPGGTKSIKYPPTTPNNENNDVFWNNNSNINLSQKRCDKNTKLLQNSKFKRQLFNNNNNNNDNENFNNLTNNRKSMSSFDIIRKEKQQNKVEINSLNVVAGGEKVNKVSNLNTVSPAPSRNKNSLRLRTKSQIVISQPNNIKDGKNVVQRKERQQKKIDEHQNSTNNQISLKFNPNFDSWTNFSFTKNFITNVFC